MESDYRFIEGVVESGIGEILLLCNEGQNLGPNLATIENIYFVTEYEERHFITSPGEVSELFCVVSL